MNKKIFFVFLLLPLSLISISQDSNENFYSLKMRDFFKPEAIVFKESYKVSILIKDLKKRYTPDTSDILKAENIFLDKYHLLNVEPRSLNRTETQKMFYKYKRQFFGYINENNEKKVIIQLIDCSKPGRTKRILGKGWDKNFVIHFSEYRVVKIFIYSINLDKGLLDQM